MSVSDVIKCNLWIYVVQIDLCIKISNFKLIVFLYSSDVIYGREVLCVSAMKINDNGRLL